MRRICFLKITASCFGAIHRPKLYHGMVKTIPYIGAVENWGTGVALLPALYSVLLIALSVWLVPRQPALPKGEAFVRRSKAPPKGELSRHSRD